MNNLEYFIIAIASIAVIIFTVNSYGADGKTAYWQSCEIIAGEISVCSPAQSGSEAEWEKFEKTLEPKQVVTLEKARPGEKTGLSWKAGNMMFRNEGRK